MNPHDLAVDWTQPADNSFEEARMETRRFLAQAYLDLEAEQQHLLDRLAGGYKLVIQARERERDEARERIRELEEYLAQNVGHRARALLSEDEK